MIKIKKSGKANKNKKCNMHTIGTSHGTSHGKSHDTSRNILAPSYRFDLRTDASKKIFSDLRHELKNMLNQMVMFEYESTGNNDITKSITKSVDKLINEEYIIGALENNEQEN